MSLDPLLTRAQQKNLELSFKKWRAIKTPIYDELISKLELELTGRIDPTYGCSEKNQDLFWSYTKKLKHFNEPLQMSVSGTGYVAIPICNRGQGLHIHLAAFQDSEKEQYIGLSRKNFKNGIESIKNRKTYAPSRGTATPFSTPAVPIISSTKKFLHNAIVEWHKIPTPIYDEMVSKMEVAPTGRDSPEYACSKENEEIFWFYTKILKKFKPATRPRNAPQTNIWSPQGNTGSHITRAGEVDSKYYLEDQPLCFNTGIMNGNQLHAFKDSEKSQYTGFASYENLRLDMESKNMEFKNRVTGGRRTRRRKTRRSRKPY